MAAEAAIGATTGLWLFGYNRGNYMYDASFRYERFTTGREFAIQQTEQYRNDLKKLTELVQKKNSFYAIFASLACALCIALYCAGRLGLHGPSPPAWIIGLWYTNNAAAFSYMIVTMWLAFHAAFRAQSASTNLLTRHVRVPVPTLRQLDKARKFASEFEQQSVTDILRVPYLSRNGAPKTDDAAPETADPRASARPGSAPPTGRAGSSTSSSWIREEFETDKAGTVTGPPRQRANIAPEHFQLYEQVQKYWYNYDIYARICLLYGYLSLFHGFAYYGMGHINIELRAFWVPYAVVFILMVLHALLLRFDIIQGNTQKSDVTRFLIWLGPVAPLPAAIGMSLDFRVEFEMHAVVLCWIFIFISYGLQFLYTIRLLVILVPEDFRMSEFIGGSMWPESWPVPTSFLHVLYLVVPPKALQPGQHDTVRELKEGPQDGGADASADDAGEGVMSTAELKSYMQYVNRLFEWVFLDEVFLRMSKSGKERVQELHRKFMEIKIPNLISTPEENFTLARTLKECVSSLEAVTSREGLGYLDSDGSGEDSSPEDYGVKGPGSSGARTPNLNSRLQRISNSPFEQTQHIHPWKLVASVTVALLIGWVFMIGGVLIDLILGEQALVTAPHWSRPPLTRQSKEPHELGTPLGGAGYAGSMPWLPEHMLWHEEKRHAHMDMLGGRRLAAAAPDAALAGEGLSAAFASLLDTLPGAEAGGSEVAEQITWPGFFEPQLLACGPPAAAGASTVTALTPRGFGATARINQSLVESAVAQTFKLAGISHLPPLLSASWGPLSAAGARIMGENGLWLVSRAGHLITCPGPHPSSGGTWHCSQPADAVSSLPVAMGSKIAAAAASWLSSADGEMRLHAALVDESAPDVVALFALDKADEGSSWSPIGEVLVPQQSSGGPAGKVSVAFVDGSDLLVTTDAGAMVRRRLHDGAVVSSATRPWGPAGSIERRDSWRSTCACSDKVAHLHLQQRRPAIITSSLPVLSGLGLVEGMRRASVLPPVYA